MQCATTEHKQYNFIASSKVNTFKCSQELQTKSFELKLHVHPNVPPVAQRLRRVPFALRDNVKAQINELLEGDIIERVEGPTTWASPVVVAPKLSSEKRLCMDMRRAN